MSGDPGATLMRDTRLRACSGVLWREMRGGPVVLNVETGRYFHLLGSSAVLWRLAGDGLGFGAIVEEAAAAHGVPPAEIEPDARAFFESAIDQGLLLVDPNPALASPSADPAIPAIEIGRSRLKLSGDIDRLREDFARRHFVTLPDLIEPAVLEVVERSVREGQFVDRTHAGIGTELCLAPGSASSALQLLFNDPALFDLVRRIAGCEPLRCFDGRVYRMLASEGHHDSWHSDADKERRVAVSVNLGRERFEGGVLELRRSSSAHADAVVPPAPFGGAVMFRISPDLRHRVTPVGGSMPRTAYAGWFCSSPDFEDAFFATLRT